MVSLIIRASPSGVCVLLLPTCSIINVMVNSKTLHRTRKLLFRHFPFKFDMNDCWPTTDLSGSPTLVDFFGISPLLPFRGFSHLQQENIICHRSGTRCNGVFVFSGVFWWWQWCLVWWSVETTQELETEVHSSPHSLVSHLSLQLLFLDPFLVAVCHCASTETSSLL